RRTSSPTRSTCPAASRPDDSPSGWATRPTPRRGLRLPAPARTPQPAPRPADRVEVHVGRPLLEGDDRVVRDVDVLRADLGAALGDVAHPDAGLAPQQRPPVGGVLRVHLQPGYANHEAGAEERVLAVVPAQHVAHVLAQEALDALAELD